MQLVSADSAARVLIIIAYGIIVVQFAVRWYNLGKLGNGRTAVILLMAIFVLRMITEFTRLAGMQDSVRSVLYWFFVIVAWLFVIKNHAATIADALSDRDERSR